MTCPKCSQEHDDNQACQNCAPEPVIDPNAGKQPESNLSPTVSPPEDGLENQPANPGNSGGINVGGSDIKAGRDVNFYLKAIATADATADQSSKGEEEKSLYDLVKPLSLRPQRYYRPANLQEMVASLIRDQVILISSSYDEYALDAAWEVIEAMPDSPDRFSGRLAFEDTTGKGVEFSPQKLCEQRPEGEPATVLLVDALDSQANTFAASMLGHSARVEAARQDLRNSKLFLVVVVNHKYATE